MQERFFLFALYTGLYIPLPVIWQADEKLRHIKMFLIYLDQRIKTKSLKRKYELSPNGDK